MGFYRLLRQGPNILLVKVRLANSSCLDLIIFTILGPNGALKAEMVQHKDSAALSVCPYIAALYGNTSQPHSHRLAILPLRKHRLFKRIFRSSDRQELEL